MFAQQPEQIGDPSLILHERLPLAFMQITHFILVFSVLSCKISPFLGGPVLRDAAAGREQSDSND
jgi:hypothetical protein